MPGLPPKSTPMVFCIFDKLNDEIVLEAIGTPMQLVVKSANDCLMLSTFPKNGCYIVKIVLTLFLKLCMSYPITVRLFVIENEIVAEQ